MVEDLGFQIEELETLSAPSWRGWVLGGTIAVQVIWLAGAWVIIT
jgi:hypothetical protein